ncbi:DUF5959 family protein [Streptomyces sp. NBC_01092]|uniref:DUF5959 family protein n=1 Tax=Streptomyces sp. NBC_01092 TaxID=2903748 RepID=UPI00386BA20E|nr:DUF5959 family protein [Streptomyces sp. NBC_01092]
MGDSPPREFISVADDEGNNITANVLGRNPRWAAGLDAEKVVKTPFMSGRIDLALYVSKLESWADALDKLDAGEDVPTARGRRSHSSKTTDRKAKAVVHTVAAGQAIALVVRRPELWARSASDR